MSRPTTIGLNHFIKGRETIDKASQLCNLFAIVDHHLRELFHIVALGVVLGEPRETVMRFQALQRGFFDFPAFDIGEISDHRTQIRINYQMSNRAEEAACHQSAGFFDRLLEIAGAKERTVELEKKRWRGDLTTLLSMRY